MKKRMIVFFGIIVITFFLISCTNKNDEIVLIKKFKPSESWKVELLKTYENKFLENQKPVAVFYYYSNSLCRISGKTYEKEAKPGFYVVLVDKWPKEKYAQFERMQAEVEKASDERDKFQSNCIREHCSQDDYNRVYNSAMQVEVSSPCIINCSSESERRFKIDNKYEQAPHIQSPYIPDYSTKKYSLYVPFSEFKEEKNVGVGESDPNKGHCGDLIYREAIKIEDYLCKNRMLYQSSSSEDYLYEDCGIFEIEVQNI